MDMVIINKIGTALKGANIRHAIFSDEYEYGTTYEIEIFCKNDVVLSIKEEYDDNEYCRISIMVRGESRDYIAKFSTGMSIKSWCRTDAINYWEDDFEDVKHRIDNFISDVIEFSTRAYK